MQEIKLQAEIRSGGCTKKELSDLRAGSRVPGVLYGGSGASVVVVVSEKELLEALRKGGANTILRLTHAKGEDTVIVKELQRHVVTNRPIHADFQRISLKEKIEVKVPIHLVGEAPGVKLQGGVLQQPLHELRVRCLPNAIPQRIEVEVGALDVGQHISISGLKVPEGVEVHGDPAQIVVSVVHVAVEAAPAAEAAATPGAGEPEVIAKGKKDEEGAEGEKGEAKAGAKPEAAKPGAKPEAGKAGAKPEAGKKEGK